MQVMSILAKCRFCQKRLCCAEHRRIHERATHSISDIVNLKGKRKWCYLTESSLKIHVYDADFPVHCLYCSMIFSSKIDLRNLLTSNVPCLPQIPDQCHLLAKIPPSDKNERNVVEETPTLNNMEKKPTPNVENTCTPIHLQHNGGKFTENIKYMSTSTPYTYYDAFSGTPKCNSTSEEEEDEDDSPLAIKLISPIEEQVSTISVIVHKLPIVTPHRGIIVLAKKLSTDIDDAISPLQGTTYAKQRKVTFSSDTPKNNFEQSEKLSVVKEERLDENQTDLGSSSIENEDSIINVTDNENTENTSSNNQVTDCKTDADPEDVSHLKKITSALHAAWKYALAGLRTSRTLISRNDTPSTIFWFGNDSTNERSRLCASCKCINADGHKSSSKRRRIENPYCISPRPPLSRMKFDHT